MSDLVGNPEDRFSRVAAQFITILLSNYVHIRVLIFLIFVQILFVFFFYVTFIKLPIASTAHAACN